MVDSHLKVGGYTFSDNDLDNFYGYFRTYLQQKLRNPTLSSCVKHEVNICSNILGDSIVQQLSPAQSSFRRDLKLVCEAAGVRGSRLFISDDPRFIETVIDSKTVRRIFKKCAKNILGIHPFPLHVKAIGKVVPLQE